MRKTNNEWIQNKHTHRLTYDQWKASQDKIHAQECARKTSNEQRQNKTYKQLALDIVHIIMSSNKDRRGGDSLKHQNYFN